MNKYGNRGGNPEILIYEIKVNRIIFEFYDRSKYLYTNLRARVL